MKHYSRKILGYMGKNWGTNIHGFSTFHPTRKAYWWKWRNGQRGFGIGNLVGEETFKILSYQYWIRYSLPFILSHLAFMRMMAGPCQGVRMGFTLWALHTLFCWVQLNTLLMSLSNFYGASMHPLLHTLFYGFAVYCCWLFFLGTEARSFFGSISSL